MPVCSRCGIDQPPDAFSDESQPLCECCYAIELEEEAAGGAILPGDDDNIIEREGLEQDMDQAEQQDDEEEVVEEKPRKPIPLSSAARILTPQGELIDDEDDDDNTSPPDMKYLDDLVNAIEERGYSAGFGLDSRDVLRVRLKRVFFDESNAVITWLTRPLVQALIEGPTSSAMTLRVTPLNRKESVMQGQSLLHWLVQWKLLQLQCGWRGHDDLVDLLIRAGAPVNATLQNGCTPLFFAVKYGSVDTVRLLMDGGANPLQTDCRNQTCLRNALPQASPYVLKYLLQHNVDSEETFATELYNGNKTRINALDVMVTEFVTPQPDVSWATLRMPSVDDYVLCMLLFLKRGIQISPHYPDVTYFLGEYLQGNIKAVKRAYYTRRIADFMFGQWLPATVREELTREDKQVKSHGRDSPRTGSCSLCESAVNNSNPQDIARPSKSSPQIQLYCGDSFCRDCILQHAQSTTNSAAQCPTCNMPLCEEIRRSQSTLQSTTNAVSTTKSVDDQRHAKLSQLSLKQLQFECEARNLVIAEKDRKDHCVQAIVADWQDFTLSGGLQEGDPNSRLMAELSLSNTMISQDNYLWVAPSLGSGMIPIVVKGVPIFALLSTTSPYTMVSPRFVQQFGFELNTNLQVTLNKPLKFVRAEDDDQKAGTNNPVNNNPNLAPAPPKPKIISAPHAHLVGVRDFGFALGKSGIEVQLPSAVQIYEPHTQDWPVGVVLGLDFLQSAAWAQLSVEVDLEVCLGRTVALLTGGSGQAGLDFDLIEPRRANRVEEDLRYYAKDGKMFWTPLWHVSLSKLDGCLSLGQYLQQLLPYPNKRRDTNTRADGLLESKVTECAWCCRQFPFVKKDNQRDLIHWIWSHPINTGMIQCLLCEDRNTPTFYCDKKCQQQAMSIHGSCQHTGVDLSLLKLKEPMTMKNKLYIVAASIIVIGMILSYMLGGGKPVQSDFHQGNGMDTLPAVGIESEL